MFVAPLAAALVAAAFAARAARTALGSRSAAMGAWAIALAQFALASAALAGGFAFGWSGPLYRAYYLFGAVLNVPWLGLGTVWLLMGRPVTLAATVVVVVASVAAAVVVAGAEFLPGADAAFAQRVVVSGSDVFGHGIRNVSRAFSFTGLVVLLTGLVWSRVRRGPSGLGLLTLGVVIVFAGSELARHGSPLPFSLALATGIAVMYAGFTRTQAR